MNEKDLSRFMRLRDVMIAALRKDAEFWGDGGKGYDGTFAIVMPGAWVQEWAVRLDSYAIGPSRHYEWYGRTFGEAIASAERDVYGWVAEAATNRIQEIHELASAR